jgi:DNA-binding response OmpR family regulator
LKTQQLAKMIPSVPSISVALVEDDELLRAEVSDHLRGHGFLVNAVNSARALDDLITQTPVDIFVVDLNLPGEDGLSLSNRLRRTLPDAGIVIMTAKVTLNDRIAGYDVGGADVYLTKPVVPDELVMILRSLGRRVKPVRDDQALSLSLRQRTLQGASLASVLRLTMREKSLLVALAQAQDNTLDSAVLCDVCSGHAEEETISKHALEEIVARLRKKIRSAQSEGAEPALKSVWGVGYQLCVQINLVP